MLEVRDLTVRYGGIEALRGVSFRIEAGQVVAIIGSNGAGKSTTLKALAGLVRPHTGSVQFESRSIFGLPSHRLVPLGISLIPEGRKIFPNQTIWDNLMLGGYARRGEDLRPDAERMLDRFPILRERRDQRAGSLSGGQQQMLAIARGLMSRPRLLLMDEPSIGLAPQLVEEVFGIVNQLRGESITILLVEQMAAAALALADRGYVLEQGRVVMEGAGHELIADSRVRAAYLGRAAIRGEGDDR